MLRVYLVRPGTNRRPPEVYRGVAEEIWQLWQTKGRGVGINSPRDDNDDSR